MSRRPESNYAQQLIICFWLLLQEHLAQTQPVRQLRGALDHQLLHLRIRNAGKTGIRYQGGRQTTVEVFEKTVSEYVGSDGIRLISKSELGMTTQWNRLTPIGLEVEKLQGLKHPIGLILVQPINDAVLIVLASVHFGDHCLPVLGEFHRCIHLDCELRK